MKQETKTTTIGIAFIVGIFIMVFSIGYGIRLYETRDKYQVGDIVEVRYEREFSTSIYYHRIVKVGKKYYLTQEYTKDGFLIDNNNEELKFWLNDRGTKLKRMN